MKMTKLEYSRYYRAKYPEKIRAYNRKSKLKIRSKQRLKRLKDEQRKAKISPLLVSNGFIPRKGRVKKCKLCKVPFYVSKCFNDREFCCFKHIHEYSRKQNMHSCKYCKELFYCTPSQLKLRNRNSCSIKCRAKLQTIRAEKKYSNKKLSKGVLNRRLRYSKKADIWRKCVFERDNYTCQKCGNRSSSGNPVYLQAHHIEQFVYFPELRFEITNGLTVCKECHKKLKHYRIGKDKKGKKKIIILTKEEA